ncbi:MAG: hypothetical protein DRI86_11800, partial [Bacteroidetes bacterium]
GLEMLQHSPNKEEFFEELIELLKDESPDVRSFAVEVLSEIKENDPFPHILNLITDENKAVRISALMALSKNPSEDYIAYIAPLTKDREIAVQKAALRALSKISSPKTLDTVIKATIDKSETIATEAKNILVNYAGHVPSSLIEDYINYPDSSIRYLVIEYLVEKVDTDPILFYLQALKDSEESIRVISLLKLRNFISKPPNKDSTLSIVKDIIPLLNDPSKKVRFQALKVLEILKDSSSVEHLITIATRDPEEDIRSLATEVIVSIRRALRLGK